MLHIKDWKLIAESSDSIKIDLDWVETIDHILSEEERVKIKDWFSIKIKDSKLVFLETTESRKNESLKYREKRAAGYPAIEDYIDAQVKKSSEEDSLRNEWVQQEKKYFEKCISIKNKYKKT